MDARIQKELLESIYHELLESVCREWRSDFGKILAGKDRGYKEFLNHKNNCLVCLVVYARVEDYLVRALFRY